jgi:hypothetical protein
MTVLKSTVAHLKKSMAEMEVILDFYCFADIYSLLYRMN